MKNINLKLDLGVIALALIIMGFFIYKGLKSFSDNTRTVSVRGLSERIVDVDYANLTINYAVGGNDMQQILKEIEQKNAKVKQFAISKGLKENEITINVPSITDKQNQQYGGYDANLLYRYYATVAITFISNNVKSVRDLEENQFDLFKEGINLITQYSYNRENEYTYSFTKLNDIKPDMIKESIENAKKAANEFAQSSKSKIKDIKSASQGQFSITPTDNPLKMKVRVVSTIEYFIK